jgi:hypothetical protein
MSRSCGGGLSGSQRPSGRLLEVSSNRHPREMIALDKTRLTGPLGCFCRDEGQELRVEGWGIGNSRQSSQLNARTGDQAAESTLFTTLARPGKPGS